MASRSWNRVELIGNLTRDPELRYTPNGAAVCTFGMATNRTYISEGERREEADFHRLVSWNKLAELCQQLLKKGNRVFISGRLQTRSWEAQDGTQRQTTEIVIEDMILLTPKSNGETVTTAEDVSVEPATAAESKSQRVPPEERLAKGGKESKTEEKKTEAVKEPKPESEQTEKTPPQEEVGDDLPF